MTLECNEPLEKMDRPATNAEPGAKMCADDMHGSYSRKEGPFWGAMVGFAFFVSILSLPIGMGLTTARMTILLLTFLTLFKLISRDFKLPPRTLLPLATALVPFGAYAISMVMNGGRFWPLFSWLPLGLLGTCIAICVCDFDSHHCRHFFWAMLFLELITWGWICGKLYHADLLLSGNQDLIHWFENNFANGMTRFMNSMVVCSCVNFVALSSGVFKKIISKIVLFVPIYLTIYFSLNLGSRQSLLTIIGFYLFLQLVRIASNRRFSELYHSFLRVVLFVFIVASGLFIAIGQDWLKPTWIDKRFMDTLVTQEISLRSDETRIYLVKKALRYSRENNGFGIGPGHYPDLVKIYPHNGYAGFLAEAGLLPGGAALFLIALVVIYCWRLRKTSLSPLSEYIWAVFVFIALFMVNLNDLFREPLFWVPFGLAVGFSARKNQP